MADSAVPPVEPAEDPVNDPPAAVDDAEAEMARLLEEAGLGADAVDPSSLEALRDYVRETPTKMKHDAMSVSTFGEDWGGDTDDDEDEGPAPFADVPASPSKKVVEMLSDADAEGSSNLGLDSLEPPLTANPNGGTVMKTNDLNEMNRGSTIEEQLQFQTKLILELHHQLQVLTEKVERLEGSKSTEGTAAPAQQRSSTPRTTTPVPAPEPQQPREQQQPRRIFVARNVNVRIDRGPAPPGRLRGLFSPLIALWTGLRESRVVRILALYWEMSAPHVRPVDGTLIFKLLFFGLVVMGRLNRRSNDSPLNQYKFIGGCILMVFGVLYHTKYLQFTYKFVFQDQVPLRVWNGEVQNNQAVEGGAEGGNNQRGIGLPPRPPQRNNEGAGGRFQFLRNTFFGGLIVPRADQAAIVAIIQDALYLFGSFWLSIFPMWQPEGPPPPPPEQPPVADQPEGPEQPPQDDQQGIPRVAPPRDAIEAAEDD